MRWTQEQLETFMAKFHHPIDDLDTPDEGKESILQRKIEKWALEWGKPWLSLRQSKAAKRLLPAGWPDVTLIMPNGKVLFIELKSARGTLSSPQTKLRLQFMALGHTVHLIKSYKSFLGLVEGQNRNGNKP